MDSPLNGNTVCAETTKRSLAVAGAKPNSICEWIKEEPVLLQDKRCFCVKLFKICYLRKSLGAKPNSSLKARLNQEGSLKPTS